MFNSFDDLMNYLNTLRSSDYQRDNFDKFLHKVKFNFVIPSIHIAGTNGKGSTAKMINDCLINQGYKVGFYQSPYFVYPNETINVNNHGISLDFFDKIISKYQKEIKKYSLSLFEVETFVAFNYFIENNCDICVIECGMGGETDATNIFTPILSIITSISLEHTAFLGSSISEIAKEKSGIIKYNVPCLVGDLVDDALLTIAQVCKELDSQLIITDKSYDEKRDENGYNFDCGTYKKLHLNNIGFYEIKNACLAISALNIIKENFPISEENIRKSLNEFIMPGRMTIVNKNPLFIVDGAHNPEAMKELRKTIENGNIHGIYTVFASFKDKNIDTMLADISVVSSQVTLTTFPHSRARTEDDYFLYLGDYQYQEDCFAAINDLRQLHPDSPILICGSLAFAGYILNNLDKINLGGEKND